MDAKEEALQREKMQDIKKMVLLLEEIAFNTSSRMVERSAYLERIYAVSQSSATALHGDVRTQPATRAGEVSEHDATAVSRFRIDSNNRPSQTQGKKP